MAATKLSTAIRNARVDAITAQVGNAGKLRIYTGAPPANPATAPTGTLLAEFTLGTPFAAAGVGGVLSPNLPAQVNAAAGGTAGWFRVFKADGTTACFDGDVTATGGGGDMQIGSTAITAGGPVQITSWTITDANA